MAIKNRNKNINFNSECGGYVNGKGVISVPSTSTFLSKNYLDGNQSGCFWFVEARQASQTILLTRHASLTSSDDIYPMTVSN